MIGIHLLPFMFPVVKVFMIHRFSSTQISYFFVLNTQSCRLGPDRCPQRGCSDTKRLLLHIKTCSVAPGGGYGCTVKGCDSARKLLNHYKRCRDVRARQAAQQQKTNTASKKRKSAVVFIALLISKRSFFYRKIFNDQLSQTAIFGLVFIHSL